MSLTQVLEVNNIGDSFKKIEFILNFGDFMVNFGILCPNYILDISHTTLSSEVYCGWLKNAPLK